MNKSLMWTACKLVLKWSHHILICKATFAHMGICLECGNQPLEPEFPFTLEGLQDSSYLYNPKHSTRYLWSRPLIVMDNLVSFICERIHSFPTTNWAPHQWILLQFPNSSMIATTVVIWNELITIVCCIRISKFYLLKASFQYRVLLPHVTAFFVGHNVLLQICRRFLFHTSKCLSVLSNRPLHPLTEAAECM